MSEADRRDDPDDRAIGRAAVVIMLLLFPMQFIHPYFTDAGLPHIVWLLMGVVAAGLWYGGNGRATGNGGAEWARSDRG
jgi:hypothetical protein